MRLCSLASLLLAAWAGGADLTLDHAIPVRFGASLVEVEGKVRAKFSEDRGITLPIQVTSAGEVELVAQVIAPNGRRFRLQSKGQGLNFEVESVGTGAAQDLVLGKAKVAAGLGRLELNSPSSRNLQLLGLRVKGVEVSAPPVVPLRTTYIDLNKGSHHGWRGLSLKDTGTARIPLSVARATQGFINLDYEVAAAATLKVGVIPYALSVGKGVLRVPLSLPVGTSLIHLEAKGAEIRLHEARFEGIKVSQAYPLPSGAAQSVHFGYPIPEGVDARWAYAEAIAEPGPEATYHCVLGFGQGYFGYQVRYKRGRPDDRWFIYSLWDNGYVRNQDKSETKEELRDKVVTLVAKGESVDAYAFDHEGSGGHSHLDFRWQDQKTYRFLLGVVPDTDAAVFSAWISGPEMEGWRFMASFRRPKTVARLDGLYSFVEDWSGHQGDQQRACRYRNLWVADRSGKWHRLAVAHTSATNELGRKDFGHRILGDTIELRTGGYQHAEGKVGESLLIPAGGEAPRIDFSQLPKG